jgi:hypothetical protein
MRRTLCLDDSLTLLRKLTWRSRLHGVWHRLILCLTGARYTAKLLRLAHKNIRVLRHFHRCREVKQLQPARLSRFWHLVFYKETVQQSLRLFSPIRAALPTTEHENLTPSRRLKKKAGTKTSASQAVPTCRHQLQQRTAQLVNPTAPLETLLLPQVPSPAALAKNTQEQPPRTHWKIRYKIHTWLLSLRHLPSLCVAKCRALLRIEGHKARQRQFYQQAQLTLLQEQQRIAISTQTALFLSLATAIDLKAARELTAAGQLVGKHRQQKTMTAEDIACFDQSLNVLDGNHETIRVAVQ